ncbi:MAG: hypothetical protein LBB39_02950 [Mycoplasmataceae bacterium]|jgi:TM2 domain-containing membrane protein YozV|nr:hypothetical protein [Mycoplasmataceae bacterium]
MKTYLNQKMDKIVVVILAIIPFTSWILGGITRIMNKHYIAGVLQLLLIGEIVFWIIDIFSSIKYGKLKYFI